MNALRPIYRLLTIALLSALVMSWTSSFATSSFSTFLEWNLSEDETPAAQENEVKPAEKIAGVNRHHLTLPDRMVLSQAADQDGRLPAEHISEVPVPPPLFVR
jgi:hypothetical protein